MLARTVYFGKMRVLCVGRHAYISGHFCQYLSRLGVAATPAVGLEAAAEVARAERPDVVLVEYDLLATTPLTRWEGDPALAQLPVVAVSLTRRPEELSVADVNGIAGLLYLPTLDPETARAVLRAAATRPARRISPAMSWAALPPVSIPASTPR